MDIENLYNRTHLFVAGIRVCEHLNKNQPTVEEVCRLLKLSLEEGNFISKKLQDLDVLEPVTGAFGARLFIKDHSKIESIPRDMKISSMEEDLKKFQDSRKEFSQRIENIKAAQAEKKKSLFADVEKKLKEEIEKKKNKG
jgi:hypothetical protein